LVGYLKCLDAGVLVVCPSRAAQLQVYLQLLLPQRFNLKENVKMIKIFICRFLMNTVSLSSSESVLWIRINLFRIRIRGSVFRRPINNYRSGRIRILSLLDIFVANDYYY
jgi:hypothetical protein